MTNPTTSTTASPSNNIHSNVNPSEVGWQFVPQYYTFVNKHPNRLHCFYTKSSTFIHGTEGEDGKPCYGQQEIHNKITSIDFQDCKVFIHSVDAQSSANGGIIIQVIGEMSNRNEPWRKFVQTFFLAEQPNGYFVLNDIFRFLKEESVDESDEAADPAPTSDAPWPEQTESVESAPVSAPLIPETNESGWTPVAVAVPDVPESQPTQDVREPSPAPPPAPVEEPEPEPAPPVEAPAPVSVEASPKVNGTAEPAPEPAPVPPVVEKSPTPPPSIPEPPVVKAPSPAPPTPAPAPATPAPTQAPPAPVQQPPAPAPAPPQPKTWANLAAANSKKWGSAVAPDVRATTEVLSSPATPSPGPASGAQTPVNAQPRGGPVQHTFGNKGDAASIVSALPHAQVFIKGVIETVSDAALRSSLNRFGPLKDLDIVRSKACAFAEFTTIDGAKKAIVASLPHNMGGDGGIRIDVGESNFVKINVETKKERGERPVSNRGRGGAMQNGDRGGYYGGEGRRGGFGPRGGPRGRGIGGGK